MAQAPITTAWVHVVPETRGFREKVEKELGRDIEKTGRKQGEVSGKGFALGFLDSLRKNKPTTKDTGIEDLESGVKDVQDRIAKSSEESAAKVAAAQERVKKASERVTKAMNAEGKEAKMLGLAKYKLKQAEESLERATQEAADAQDTLQAELSETEKRLKEAKTEADEASKGMRRAFSPAWAKAIQASMSNAFDSNIAKVAGTAGFSAGHEAGENFKKGFARADVAKFAGVQVAKLSGLRAVTDFGKSISESLSDVDRNVVSLSTLGLKIGSLTSVAFGAIGVVTAFGGALGSMAGAALVLPGIFAGLAIVVTTAKWALNDFSNVLPDVVESYKGLQQIVSDNFWANAEAPIRDLAMFLLPLLEKGFADSATAMGNWADNVNIAVQSTMGMELPSQIFENIALTVENMETGVGALAGALVMLSSIGISYLPRLGTEFSNLMVQFNVWVNRNMHNGNIFRWVDEGVQQFKYLGQTIGGLFGIMGALYSASKRAGGPEGLGGIATSIQGVSEALNSAKWQDSLTAMFSGAYEALDFMGAGLASLAEGFRSFGPTLGQVLALVGESVGALLSSFGEFMAHPAVQDGVLNFFTSVRDSITTLAPAMGIVGPVFGAIATMAGQLVEAVAGTLDATLKAVGPAFLELSEAARPLIPALGDIAQAIITGAGPAIQFIGKVIGFVLTPIVKGIVWLSQFEGAWKTVGLVAGFVVTPLVILGGAMMSLFTAARVILTPLRVIGSVFGKILPKGMNLKLLFESLKNSVTLLGNKFPWLGKLISGVGKGFNAVKGFIGGLLSKIGGKGLLSVLGGLGKRFLGLLGPIGLVISIVWLLVDAVKYAWNNFEWFRNGVTAVWDWIKGAASNTVDWYHNTLVPLLQSALSTVGDVFRWLNETIIQPVWNGIKSAAQGVSTWFSTVLVPLFRNALNTLGNTFVWLRDNIVKPVWQGILTVINIALWPIKVILGGLWLLIRDVIGPGFMWLYNNAVKPMMNAIKTVIQNAWNVGIKPAFNALKAGATLVGQKFVSVYNSYVKPAWNLIKAIIRGAWNSVIKPVFNVLKAGMAYVGQKFISVYNSYVKPAWNFIKATIKNAWNNVIKPVFNALKTGITWVGQKFVSIYNSLIKPALTWLGAKARSTWQTFVKPVFDAMKRGLQVLGDKYQSVKNWIGRTWDGLKSNLKRGWTWIDNNVFSKMRAGLTILKTAFERAKEGVGRAWDQLKAKVKEPISFVVNKVINPFIGGYNDLNDFWKGDDLKKITGFATGGYTGRGSKYQAAGIVHADEYVVKKKSRRKFERENPGVLDHINATGEMPRNRPKGGNLDGLPAGVPHGPHGGIWSSVQHQMSQAGQVTIEDRRINGGDSGEAAKAWMGRSALKVNSGKGGGPQISVGHGMHGPWGFYSGNRIQINPVGPRGANATSTLIHEIGHLLSLAHAGTNSIMHPMMRGPATPSDVDYAAVRSVWGAPGEGVKTYSASDINMGSGGGAPWIDPVGWIRDKISGWVSGGISKAKASFDGNKFLKMPMGIYESSVDSVIDAAKDAIGSYLNPFGGGGSSEDSSVAESKDVQRWKPEVKKALKMAGLPQTQSYIDTWLRQIASESGGNPNAIQQVRDQNSGGNEAAGLVQVIPGTFAENRDPSLPNNRLDPMASLVAGMNYARKKYGVQGLLNVIGKGHGYAEGGLVYDGGGLLKKTERPQLVHHKKSRPDAVLTDKQWRDQRRIANATEARLTNEEEKRELHVHASGVDVDSVIRRGHDAWAWETNRRLRK